MDTGEVEDEEEVVTGSRSWTWRTCVPEIYDMTESFECGTFIEMSIPFLQPRTQDLAGYDHR